MTTTDPLLSVVVVVVSDTVDRRIAIANLAGCLEAFDRQIDPPAMEILVPYCPSEEESGKIEEIKGRFREVKFLPIRDLKTRTNYKWGREHHDELRARGLGAARGEIVGLIEDHARPDRRWCVSVIQAHEQPYAGIGGAIENDIDRPLNWAVYFCDFYRYLNPVPAGESYFLSDANVTYKRQALAAIRPIWEDIFREPSVNAAFAARGEKLALSPEITVYQHRQDLRLNDALKERFIWGRSYAAGRSAHVGRAKRMVYAALSPTLPALLLLRMTVTVMKKGRCVAAFLKALPLTALLTVTWSAGEMIGYFTGRSGPRRSA